MTPHRQGFDSRATLGLRAPRSRSTNITAHRGGVVWHWVGPAVHVSSHDDCRAQWRGIQDYHMRPGGLGARDGAADIAYNLGICPHGYVLAGRGGGVRSGANGTAEGNQNYYAICCLLGQGQRPTEAMMRALLWATRELRNEAGAGMRVRPHYDFTGSTCPGPDLHTDARGWDNQPIEGDKALDPLEAIMEELSDDEAKVLKDFASYVAQHGQGNSPGASIPRQFLIFHREERARLNEILEAIDIMDSSVRGTFAHTIAAIRVLRAIGLPLTQEIVDAVSENKHYTKEEIERAAGVSLPSL